jgi:hypothetical protein
VSNIPLNTYKNKDPFTGKVLSCKRIVGKDATGETCHIIIGTHPNRYAALTCALGAPPRPRVELQSARESDRWLSHALSVSNSCATIAHACSP